MRVGICTLPLVPIRSEPSERSEMVTQLLFGELFEVVEEKESWSLIRIHSDNYTGWCTSKMLQILPLSEFEVLKSSKPSITRSLISPCIRDGSSVSELFLPAGSRLYNINVADGSFPVYFKSIPGAKLSEVEYWHVEPFFYHKTFFAPKSSFPQEIMISAMRFINAPYLWGGKSILGMDCSGLVQLSFLISGYSLPRDARDQASVGVSVSSFTDAQAADLAFFANSEGKIVHVGILTDPGHVLHASGHVHIDRLDAKGIFSEALGQYTHTLCSIKRFDHSLNT
jgi:gamma-D-glutamyl-L-lysine dipeptidyl-peptidase